MHSTHMHTHTRTLTHAQLWLSPSKWSQKEIRLPCVPCALSNNFWNEYLTGVKNSHKPGQAPTPPLLHLLPRMVGRMYTQSLSLLLCLCLSLSANGFGSRLGYFSKALRAHEREFPFARVRERDCSIVPRANPISHSLVSSPHPLPFATPLQQVDKFWATNTWLHLLLWVFWMDHAEGKGFPEKFRNLFL